jgi:transposase InsO family protein
LIPSGFKESDQSTLIQKGEVIWVPDQARELILRLLVISHTGRGGHRGVDAIVATLRNRFHWSTLAQDVRTFVSECLHCAWVSKNVGARPLHAQVHGSRINEVIHFDFLFVGLTDQYAYVLIVKEDITGYVWLHPCAEPTAEVVIDVLTRWLSTFGIAEVWVSDKGSHFLNSVVEGLRQTLNAKHRFTLPYCSWSNGTVERVCREILRLLRALCTEKVNLSTNEWPKLISLVQLTLNGTHRTSIGTTPMNAFIGAKDSVLDAIFTSGQPSVELVSPAQVHETHSQLIINAIASLDALHTKVICKMTEERLERIRAHNARTKVVEPRFATGDFVLTAAVLGSKHVPKLCVR